MEPLHIHLQWEGPKNLDELAGLTGKWIYQICGPHPVYGNPAVLYIGKTGQSFGSRLRRRYIEWERDSGKHRIYIGRVYRYCEQAEEEPTSERLAERIDLAERLLILAHRPSHNSVGLFERKMKLDVKTRLWSAHVLNWGDRGCLLPEASGARWSQRFGSKGYVPWEGT